MAEAVELWNTPQAGVVNMVVGFRQWADAGSLSSGLPQYMVEKTGAQPIGKIRPDGFYLFQIPGTHDLVRPRVRFRAGYPVSLDTPHTDIYYSGSESSGLAVLIGDEPHLDIERYVAAVLSAAKQLNVKRIIGLGGVYGELPYNRERPVSANYSLRRLKREVEQLAVDLSDYHGGASIGSYLCRRAGERRMEYVGLYGFVPAYDFSTLGQAGSTIRLENDFTAWLGVMRRVIYMLKLDFDLADLISRSEYLVRVVSDRIDEIEQVAPDLGVREYVNRLAENFTEKIFAPEDGFWEEKLKGLFDKFDAGDSPEA
ncbi:MAG: PAC2 family protein [Chloroflexota bacterium]